MNANPFPDKYSVFYFSVRCQLLVKAHQISRCNYSPKTQPILQIINLIARYRVVFALTIINKAGGLIYQKDFADGLNKLSINDYLVLAGTFHGHVSLLPFSNTLPLSFLFHSPSSLSTPSITQLPTNPFHQRPRHIHPPKPHTQLLAQQP